MRSANRGFLAACTAGLAALLLVPAALAQQSGGGQMTGLKLSGNLPIQIESDKLEVHQNDNLAIFTGNVSVTQGTTLMKAGKMTVYYVKDEGKDGAPASSGAAAATSGATSIDHLEVEDKVYLKSEDQVATGDRGTFDMKTEVMVLLGKEVVLSQGANVLVGCKLTVQMRTGLSQVDGCGSGGKSGRVMMSITPDTVKNR